MSTRSIIVVTNESETNRLYKHCDGYPSDTLGLIKSAISKFNTFDDVPTYKKVSVMTGLLIGESVSNYGTGCWLHEGQHGRFTEEILGEQWDLEWIYIVDIDTQSVNVYGGGYTGKEPQSHYRRGTVNPLIEIDDYKEDYQGSVKDSLIQDICDLRSLGFTINTTKDKEVGYKHPMNVKRNDSFIKEVNYNSGFLDISFQSGHCYRYYYIKKDLFLNFLDTGCSGSFYNENIKGKFDVKKLKRVA